MGAGMGREGVLGPVGARKSQKLKIVLEGICKESGSVKQGDGICASCVIAESADGLCSLRAQLQGQGLCRLGGVSSHAGRAFYQLYLSTVEWATLLGGKFSL